MTRSCDSRTGPVFRDPFPTQTFNGLYLASVFSPSSVPLGRHRLRRRKLIAMSALLCPSPQALVPSPEGRQDYFSSSGKSPKSWHCSCRAVVEGRSLSVYQRAVQGPASCLLKGRGAWRKSSFDPLFIHQRWGSSRRDTDAETATC